MSETGMGKSRQLPAHIAAQLRSAGGLTDTGGQPWKGRSLSQGHQHLYPHDSGVADAALEEALQRWHRGHDDETDVVAALAGTRLFVPVMAQVSRSEITAEGLIADKEADMSLITLQAADGRKVQPVFTSDFLVGQWHEAARPVAADVRKITIAAVKDGSELVVVNPGAEYPFVVRRPAVWCIAQGKKWVPSYHAPEVSAAVLDAALGIETIVGAYVQPGRGVDAVKRSNDLVQEGAVNLRGGGLGPELNVVLQLWPGLDQVTVNRVVGEFQERVSRLEVMRDLVDSLEISLEVAHIR